MFSNDKYLSTKERETNKRSKITSSVEKELIATEED
jgi:hypothetical protein